MTVALFVLAGLVALADWYAVERNVHRLELGAKPLALALLIAAAASADLGAAKPWVFAALVLGLLGDVALMFSKSDDADLPFMLGLGSFLLGHIAYVVGFARHGLHGAQLIAGVLVVAGIASFSLPAVLKGAKDTGGRALAGPVAVYAAALAAMAVLSVGTAAVATACGGVLFLISDSLLARQRFVRSIAHGPLRVIVTYHLAQFLIVIGLVR